MSKKKLKAISLFAGAGGDTLGLEEAGFEVIYFSENNKNAIKTHLENFPNSKLIEFNGDTDITKIPDEWFEKLVGKIDLIFAGFPCQGFSHAGKKDINDDRNKLFREFLRITEIIKPKWIIGENVKGLVERKIDNVSFADIINEEFENINYKMFPYSLVNLDEYNVPQSRKRVFFVGSKNHNDTFSFPKKNNTKKEGLWKIIEDDLENSVLIDLNDFPFLKNNNDLTYIETKKRKITGKPHPFLLRKINDREISFDVRKSPTHSQILNFDKPSKTIHGGYSFQPRLYVLLKNKNKYYIRTLNENELKAIQTFPKEYKFIGNENHVILQIGNAVPPLIVKKIANEIKKTLK